MKKILLIGGSLNQTTMMHAIGKHLSDFECWFSPFYADGALHWPRRLGLMDRSIAGFGNFYRDTMEYFASESLPVDEGGVRNNYDLVVTCTDLIVQKNIRQKPVVLVQEGMTDPENFLLRAVRYLRLPTWLAVNTAATGLSDCYSYFCVASEGYRKQFMEKGVRSEKIVVTGIPNYDNAEKYKQNAFPYRGYVLVATSDTREAFKYEDREGLIRRALQIANGRVLIFKLHPNENHDWARKEIAAIAPQALVFDRGNVHEMIANCDVLITRFSTVTFTGLALGKEVITEYDIDELRRLAPIQNGGTSGRRIAELCREILC